MKMLMALAAGLVGYCYYNGRRTRDGSGRKAAPHEEVVRWEGEGGNVPSVSTPSPAPVPPRSFTQPDPTIRH